MAFNSVFSHEQLITIVQQQQGQIENLANERTRLQEENNVQRSQGMQWYQKLMEWQQYADELEKDRENFKKRDEEWRGGLTEAVKQRDEVREKFSELKKLYPSLKKDNEKIKQTLECGYSIGKGLYEEYTTLHYNYTLLLHYVYWRTPSSWDEPLALCQIMQGQEEGNPTPARTPAEGTVPFTLPPEGCFTISLNIPTIRNPHNPWNAFVGGNINVLIPGLLTIQAPCVPEIEITRGISEDKRPCITNHQTPCVSEIKTPCVSEDSGSLPCLSAEETDIELPAVSGHLNISETTSKVS